MAGERIVKIIRLPQTDDEVTLRRFAEPMRRMRLESLRNHPDSFITKHEDEVNKPLEFSINRLRGPSVHHWVAVIAESHKDRIKDEELAGLEWIAFFVLIEKEGQDLQEQVEAPTRHEQGAVEYHMAAVWVDPIARGKGLWIKMMDTAVHWIETRAKDSGCASVSITTLVRHSNPYARDLYAKYGFRIEEDDGKHTQNGEEFSCTAMRYNISGLQS